ncbi:uncharacterized protein LOC122396561 [Colletes gigas]|uniref:uncharacterized protein LOC122396561 n=1 Tax=Colletes gigas TaxID=935657 RepID=UPI001C9B15FB|nr:uncharacterized protein LOC122396561 [Colletes gigas]
MVFKLKNNFSRSCAKNQKETEREARKPFLKTEALYVALMCFATHCLSSITFEAGNRAPHANTVTKSAAFNALFRRSFNLKIVIPVTNVITGLITTIMMIVGDKHGIPYLYLPWLVNTMKGIALCEGPALLNLAKLLLPNISFPAGTFILTTFLLYVEELCIWNNAFANFQRCWKDYHYRKQCIATKMKKKLLATRKKKVLCQGDAEDKLNVTVEKLKAQQRPDEFRGKSNSQISTDSGVKPIKSILEDNSNFYKTQLWDVSG